jgi:hypothetical protein
VIGDERRLRTGNAADRGQQFQPARFDEVSAHFLAGKSGPFEDRDPYAAHRQGPAHRRAGGPAPDDDDIEAA